MIIVLWCCAQIFHFSVPWWIWVIAIFDGVSTNYCRHRSKD